MRSILVIVGLLVAGCASVASVDYHAYEGKASMYQGEGGTKVTVDNVDLWETGTPPGKFSILGVASLPMGAGSLRDETVRTAVAGKVKQMGGSAAIQINNNDSFAGVIRSSPSVVLTNEPRQMRFVVVKYA